MRLKQILPATFILLCCSNSAFCEELSSSSIIQQYSDASRRPGIESILLTAESAMREASSTLVIQRGEYGLYCPPVSGDVAVRFSGPMLFELIRKEVTESPFIGKEEFETALLHGLQTSFPCPARQNSN